MGNLWIEMWLQLDNYLESYSVIVTGMIHIDTHSFQYRPYLQPFASDTHFILKWGNNSSLYFVRPLSIFLFLHFFLETEEIVSAVKHLQVDMHVFIG